MADDGEGPSNWRSRLRHVKTSWNNDNELQNGEQSEEKENLEQNSYTGNVAHGNAINLVSDGPTSFVADVRPLSSDVNVSDESRARGHIIYSVSDGIATSSLTYARLLPGDSHVSDKNEAHGHTIYSVSDGHKTPIIGDNHAILDVDEGHAVVTIGDRHPVQTGAGSYTTSPESSTHETKTTSPLKEKIAGDNVDSADGYCDVHGYSLSCSDVPTIDKDNISKDPLQSHMVTDTAEKSRLMPSGLNLVTERETSFHHDFEVNDDFLPGSQKPFNVQDKINNENNIPDTISRQNLGGLNTPTYVLDGGKNISENDLSRNHIPFTGNVLDCCEVSNSRQGLGGLDNVTQHILNGDQNTIPGNELDGGHIPLPGNVSDSCENSVSKKGPESGTSTLTGHDLPGISVSDQNSFAEFDLTPVKEQTQDTQLNALTHLVVVDVETIPQLTNSKSGDHNREQGIGQRKPIAFTVSMDQREENLVDVGELNLEQERDGRAVTHGLKNVTKFPSGMHNRVHAGNKPTAFTVGLEANDDAGFTEKLDETPLENERHDVKALRSMFDSKTAYGNNKRNVNREHNRGEKKRSMFEIMADCGFDVGNTTDTTSIKKLGSQSSLPSDLAPISAKPVSFDVILESPTTKKFPKARPKAFQSQSKNSNQDKTVDIPTKGSLKDQLKKEKDVRCNESYDQQAGISLSESGGTSAMKSEQSYAFEVSFDEPDVITNMKTKVKSKDTVRKDLLDLSSDLSADLPQKSYAFQADVCQPAKAVGQVSHGNVATEETEPSYVSRSPLEEKGCVTSDVPRDNVTRNPQGRVKEILRDKKNIASGIEPLSPDQSESSIDKSLQSAHGISFDVSFDDVSPGKTTRKPKLAPKNIRLRKSKRTIDSPGVPSMNAAGQETSHKAKNGKTSVELVDSVQAETTLKDPTFSARPEAAGNVVLFETNRREAGNDVSLEANRRGAGNDVPLEANRRGTYSLDDVSKSLCDASEFGLTLEQALENLANKQEASDSASPPTAKRGTYSLDDVSNCLVSAANEGLSVAEALDKLATSEQLQRNCTESVTSKQATPSPDRRGTYDLSDVSKSLDSCVGIETKAAVNQTTPESDISGRRGTYDLSDVSKSLDASEASGILPENALQQLLDECESELQPAREVSVAHRDKRGNRNQVSCWKNDHEASTIMTKRGTYNLEDLDINLIQEGEVSLDSDSGHESSSDSNLVRPKRGTFDLEEVSDTLTSASKGGTSVEEALEKLSKSEKSMSPRQLRRIRRQAKWGANSQQGPLDDSLDSSSYSLGVAGSRGTYTLDQVAQSLELTKSKGIPVIEALNDIATRTPANAESISLQGAGSRNTYTLDQVAATLESAKEKGLPVITALENLVQEGQSDKAVFRDPAEVAVHRRQGKLVNRKTYALAKPLETIGEDHQLRLFDGTLRKLIPLNKDTTGIPNPTRLSSDEISEKKQPSVVQTLDLLTSACELLLKSNNKPPDRSREEIDVDVAETTPAVLPHEPPKRGTYSLDEVSTSLEGAVAMGIPVVDALDNIASVPLKKRNRAERKLKSKNSKSEPDLTGIPMIDSSKETHSLYDVTAGRGQETERIPVVIALDELTDSLSKFSGSVRTTDQQRTLDQSQTAHHTPSVRRGSGDQTDTKPRSSPGAYPPTMRNSYSLDDVVSALEKSYETGVQFKDYLPSMESDDSLLQGSSVTSVDSAHTMEEFRESTSPFPRTSSPMAGRAFSPLSVSRISSSYASADNSNDDLSSTEQSLQISKGSFYASPGVDLSAKESDSPNQLCKSSGPFRLNRARRKRLPKKHNASEGFDMGSASSSESISEPGCDESCSKRGTYDLKEVSAKLDASTSQGKVPVEALEELTCQDKKRGTYSLEDVSEKLDEVLAISPRPEKRGTYGLEDVSKKLDESGQSTKVLDDISRAFSNPDISTYRDSSKVYPSSKKRGTYSLEDVSEKLNESLRDHEPAKPVGQVSHGNVATEETEPSYVSRSPLEEKGCVTSDVPRDNVTRNPQGRVKEILRDKNNIASGIEPLSPDQSESSIDKSLQSAHGISFDVSFDDVSPGKTTRKPKLAPKNIRLRKSKRTIDSPGVPSMNAAGQETSHKAKNGKTSVELVDSVQAETTLKDPTFSARPEAAGNVVLFETNQPETGNDVPLEANRRGAGNDVSLEANRRGAGNDVPLEANRRGTYSLDDVSKSLCDASEFGLTLEQALENLANKQEASDSASPPTAKRGTYSLDDVSNCLVSAANEGLSVAEALDKLATSEQLQRNCTESVTSKQATPSPDRRGTYDLSDVSKSLDSCVGIETKAAVNQTTPESDISGRRGTYDLSDVSKSLDAREELDPGRRGKYSVEDVNGRGDHLLSDQGIVEGSKPGNRGTYSLDDIGKVLDESLSKEVPVVDPLRTASHKDALDSSKLSLEDVHLDSGDDGRMDVALKGTRNSAIVDGDGIVGVDKETKSSNKLPIFQPSSRATELFQSESNLRKTSDSESVTSELAAKHKFANLTLCGTNDSVTSVVPRDSGTPEIACETTTRYPLSDTGALGVTSEAGSVTLSEGTGNRVTGENVTLDSVIPESVTRDSVVSRGVKCGKTRSAWRPSDQILNLVDSAEDSGMSVAEVLEQAAQLAEMQGLGTAEGGGRFGGLGATEEGGRFGGEGLTPEQQKRRDKFLKMRQKRQEEDKAKKEAEMEKKRRREERQREAEAQKKLEEERRQQEEEIRRARLQQERLSRASDGAGNDGYATYRPGSGSNLAPAQDDHSAFAEFSGPQCYVKPSGKSNRKLIVNAISYVCLSGTVNKDAKERCLQAISESNGYHFMVLFKDGLKFRGLYSFNPENEQLYKVFGIGPRVITAKMIDNLYKYSSGGKEFVKIHSKTLSISVDGLSIMKQYWQSSKPAVQSKTMSNIKRPPKPPR
ncbi:predicted protein [Nematostella vectensis]|uniref:CKK domain-containing protein n=1 Tax=Nematostella vectensis TaxID=45351 RepID=A7RQ86_NEMVE|nr:predicted protein [Nematostella vectensis]|eukprot:XP_001638377.1 predicted protein [Nematostella vectensis]